MISETFLQELSLLGCLWQSTVFISLGLLIGYFLRNRPSRAYQVLLLAMIGAIALPLMSAVVKGSDLGIFSARAPRPPSIVLLEKPIVSPSGQMSSMSDFTVRTTYARIPSNSIITEMTTAEYNIPWRTAAMYGWMVITFAILARLTVTFLYGAYLVRNSQGSGPEHIQQTVDRIILKLGLSCGLQVRRSYRVRSPVVWCWSRPSILLVPKNCQDAGVDWSGVVAHELAHCGRLDHITGFIAELVVCALPWNPLMWLAKKSLVRFGEQACDDWVIATGQPCEDYAESLLSFRPQRQMAFLPAVVHSKKGLAARVDRILRDGCSNPRMGVAWAFAACIVAICLTMGTAFAQTRSVNTQREEKSTTQLHQAAASGDLEEIKKLIAEGAELNARDDEGRTPLHLAIELHRWKVAEYLTSVVSDVNLTNKKGQTPLHLTLINWNANLAGQLLARGADVHARDKDWRTALHEAARRSQKAIVKQLITEGADINAQDTVGSTPVMEAIRGGRLLFADELIQMGADVSCGHLAAYIGDLAALRKVIENTDHADSPWGFTWLHAAAAGGHREIIEFLIEKGFDINAITQELVMDPGGTPLHYAACRGSKEVVELLLDKGAELDADKGDSTPLAWAAWANQKDMAELLVSKGADVNKGEPPLLHKAIEWWETPMAEILLGLGADINVRDKKGNTPLHRATHDWFFEMGDLLISRGAYLNARNKEGQTPLHMAAADGFIKMAELLVEKGANVNAKDKNDGTPLHLAAGKGHKNVVELLIAKGADINAKYNDGETPLHWAAYGGHKDVAELLVLKGAGIYIKTKEGRTALHEAAEQGHRSVVEFLIGKDAEVIAKDNQGRTSLQLAENRGHNEIVELLKKHGAKE